MLIGSPMIVIQLALYTYMTIYGVHATLRVFAGSRIVQTLYTLLILSILALAITSLLKTYTVEPGIVSQALVEKLQNQLLTGILLDKYTNIRGEMNRRQYLLKCLN